MKNPYIKKANAQHEYNIDQVLEIEKCKNDVVYFVRTYCRIAHPVKGEIPFELYPYQEHMLRVFSGEILSIVLSARQTGKSQTSAAFLLWFAMFNMDKTILIASNKNDNAMEMIKRIRFMYERMPHWLKAGVNSDGWNKHSIGFDNGSSIHSTATSENSGRGLAISLLFLDEFAHVRDTVQQEFWTSMAPTLATGGSCIICSTPNGDTELFAQLWRGSQLKLEGGFCPIEVKWDEPPGRDAKFREKEIAKIGELRWRQEYLCEFLSSDPMLIDTIVVANLQNAIKKISPIGTIGEITFYKQPEANTTYLVGMDVATGSGKDFTTLEVFEFPSLDHVAEWRSNTTSSAIAYQVLTRLLRVLERTHSTVFFSVENNGVGEGIIALYEADENPPVASEFVSEDGANRSGMTTTGKSKMRACLTFKELVERGTIHISSPLLVEELKHFVRKGGTYDHKVNATSDLIMASLIVIRILESVASFDAEAYDLLYSQAYQGARTEDGEYDDDDYAMEILI